MIRDDYVLKSNVGFDEVKALVPTEDIEYIEEAIKINLEAIKVSKFALANQTTKIKISDRTYEITVWGDRDQLNGFIVYRHTNNTDEGKVFKAAINEKRRRPFNNDPKDFAVALTYPRNKNEIVTHFYNITGSVQTITENYNNYIVKRFKKYFT